MARQWPPSQCRTHTAWSWNKKEALLCLECLAEPSSSGERSWSYQGVSSNHLPGSTSNLIFFGRFAYQLSQKRTQDTILLFNSEARRSIDPSTKPYIGFGHDKILIEIIIVRPSSDRQICKLSGFEKRLLDEGSMTAAFMHPEFQNGGGEVIEAYSTFYIHGSGIWNYERRVSTNNSEYTFSNERRSSRGSDLHPSRNEE
ncbi:hypothetical protein B0O99DRAFT_594085 [Bisporella sp. PMI_857]|nr:hypothetical protein B0O99DRAFT_594085 [Bisporella sp. PMI_857]